MEDLQPSVKKIALNYGVLWGLGSVALGVVTYVTNTHMERPWWASVIGFIIMILAIVLGLKAFMKENAGYLSLGEALKTGMAITLVAAIIGAIWTYLFITLIEVDFVDKIVENAEIQMVESRPDISQEELNTAMDMTRNFTQPWIIVTIGLLGGLFLGFIVSLISGLIMKRANPMA